MKQLWMRQTGSTAACPTFRRLPYCQCENETENMRALTALRGAEGKLLYSAETVMMPPRAADVKTAQARFPKVSHLLFRVHRLANVCQGAVAFPFSVSRRGGCRR